MSVSNTSKVPSYLLESSDTEDEPELYEYKYSGHKTTQNRSNAAQNAWKKQCFDALLENATLTECEPFLYSEQIMIEPDKRLVNCAEYNESLQRLNKEYPVQEKIWPHISMGRSAILIGNTDFYPHLLYMPAICNMVKVILE